MKARGGVSLVELMHEMTGRPRSEMQTLLSKALRQSEDVARCTLHEFRKVRGADGPVWKCTNCKWVPTNAQLLAYEQGLVHGRARATGGGRFR